MSGFAAAALLVYPVILFASRLAEHLLSAPSAIIALARINNRIYGAAPPMQRVAGDPLSWYRRELCRVSIRLDVTASRVDRSMRGASLHPLATTLLAAARRLRSFAESKESLADELPADIDYLVTDIMLVLTGPVEASAYCRLAEDVGAFDKDGQPAVGRRPRRNFFVALGPGLSQFGDSSEALRKTIALAALIISGLSLIIAKLGISSFMDLLP